MKKYLPIFILILGLLILGGSYFLIFKGDKNEPTDEEKALVELPLEKQPVVSLTPTEDGHWLNLAVSGLSVVKNDYSAETMDYELLYKLPDGRTQGVPGTIKLSSEEEIERELLLGSESSGKFRYDEGVETGTLTLRFRNSKGKLISKLTSNFHLQSETDILTTPDGSISLAFEEEAEGYFVTMNTLGLIGETEKNVVTNPVGFFSSNEEYPEITEVTGFGGALHFWDGSEWSETGADIESLGIFIGLE